MPRAILQGIGLSPSLEQEQRQIAENKMETVTPRGIDNHLTQFSHLHFPTPSLFKPIPLSN